MNETTPLHIRITHQSKALGTAAVDVPSSVVPPAPDPTPSLLEHGQAYFRECGAAAERARIVAWLREQGTWPEGEEGISEGCIMQDRRAMADAIERGQHRENRDGE